MRFYLRCSFAFVVFAIAIVAAASFTATAQNVVDDGGNAVLEALLNGDESPPVPTQTPNDNTLSTSDKNVVPNSEDAESLLPPAPQSMAEGAGSKVMDLDLSEIPDVYLIEAENYRKHCQKRVLLRTYYNCECMAMEYLEKRIDVGPSMDESGIVMRLSNQCVDVTNAAGQMYKQCHDTSSLMGLRGDAERYCSCVGNNYAKIFKASNVKPSSQTFARIQSKAMRFCRAQQYNP